MDLRCPNGVATRSFVSLGITIASWTGKKNNPSNICTPQRFGVVWLQVLVRSTVLEAIPLDLDKEYENEQNRDRISEEWGMNFLVTLQV
mmetsp:Transcript_16138/g.32669  ORF Transcript_16138/g.32669 Transcript_16138/m.32669 type:complete len:89 (+) Transcript_16138:1502-1768(+)